MSVYLYANALRFVTTENRSTVRELSVGVLPEGRFSIQARLYVLAAGGIENARLLLLSESESGVGLGNDRDLVGRFFMVHLEYPGGVISVANPYINFKFQTGDSGATYSRFGVNRPFVSYVCLSEDSRRELKLPHLRYRFVYPPHQSPYSVGALKRLVSRADRGMDILNDVGSVMRDLDGIASYVTRKALFGVPTETVFLNCTSEQMPNPQSRIGLSSKRDAFNLRKVTIDWKLTTEDKHGMSFGNCMFGAELGRAGFGRLRSNVPDDDLEWPKDMYGDEHNIGTTRMHRDPKSGVVDENSRVHGISNLYVAGSSVFPTSGAFNPTLTIVALSLRLADHLKEKLG